MSGLYDTMLYVCYMLLAIGVISAPIGVFTGILILIEKRQNPDFYVRFIEKKRN